MSSLKISEWVCAPRMEFTDLTDVFTEYNGLWTLVMNSDGTPTIEQGYPVYYQRVRLH